MTNVKAPSPQIFGLFWAILGIIAVATTVPVPACADQNDPQLDDLFIALQAGPSETQAANIELEIWTKWGEHPYDPLANRQMKNGKKTKFGKHEGFHTFRDRDGNLGTCLGKHTNGKRSIALDPPNRSRCGAQGTGEKEK